MGPCAILPRASVAIFTLIPRAGTMVARFSAGPAADRLNGVAIIAQRVTGWVAANFQPMLNADAHLDLENPGDLCAVVSLPLVVDGRLVCVLSLYAPEMFTELSRTDWRSLLRTSRLLWRRPIGSAPAPEDPAAHRRAPVTRFKRSRERVPGVREAALA